MDVTMTDTFTAPPNIDDPKGGGRRAALRTAETGGQHQRGERRERNSGPDFHDRLLCEVGDFGSARP